MKNIPTNTFTTLLLVTVLCILIEGLLFENGLTFMGILGLFFIYFSMKRQKKVLFWLGIIFLSIAILSMWSLSLLLIIMVIYVLWKMYKGESTEINLSNLISNSNSQHTKNENKIFQFDDSPTDSYAWKDIHLQNLVGELSIDTTETILPKGTSFISIRQGFGKTTIYVPYELPVRIHFNTLVGEAKLFKKTYPRLWNESLSIKDGYATDQPPTRELIITTSAFFGDLEVVRK